MSPMAPLVMDVDTKLLTYAELADALGIAPASAKRLAIRRGWHKTPGNDGKARVAVPVERLEVESRPTGDSPSDDTGDDPSDVTPPIPSDVTGDTTGDTELPAFLAATAVLTQHIERLERELTGARSALEIERARAAQVDALTAILEIERKRSDEIRLERDRWAGMAEASQKQIADMTSKKLDTPMPEEEGFRGIVRRWLKVG